MNVNLFAVTRKPCATFTNNTKKRSKKPTLMLSITLNTTLVF